MKENILRPIRQTIKCIVKDQHLIAVFYAILMSCVAAFFAIFNVLPDDFSHEPPSYGALATTTGIVIASIFPVAVHVKGKKDDLEYIENRIYNFASQVGRADDSTISNAVNEYQDDILSEIRSINLGISIFALVGSISPLVSTYLFFYWGGMSLFVSGHYAIAWHLIIFSLFSWLISTMYLSEYIAIFRRHSTIFSCAYILKNNTKFDRIKKNIKSRSLKKNKLDSSVKYFTRLFLANMVSNPAIFFALAGDVIWKTSKVNLGFVFWKIDEVKLMEINYPFLRVSLLAFLIVMVIFCAVRKLSYVIFLSIMPIIGAVYFSSNDINFVALFMIIFIFWFALLSRCDLEIYRCFIYGWIFSKLDLFSKGVCLLLVRYALSYLTVIIFYSCYKPVAPLNLENIDRQFLDKYKHQDVISTTFTLLLASLIFMFIFGLLHTMNQYRKMASIFSSRLGFCNYFRENYKKNKIIFKNRKKITNFSGGWGFLNRRRDRSFSITKTPSRHVRHIHKKETKLRIYILAKSSNYFLGKNDYNKMSEKYKEKLKDAFPCKRKRDYRKIDEIFDNYDEIDEIFENNDEIDEIFKAAFRDLSKNNEVHIEEVKNFLIRIAN